MTKEIALKTDSKILSERVNELSKLLDMNIDWDKDMFGYRPRSTDKDW